MRIRRSYGVPPGPGLCGQGSSASQLARLLGALVPPLAAYSRLCPRGHRARYRVIKTEVEGNERFDADRCIQFSHKIGDHFAEDTVVVDCVLHGQVLAKNGGAMGGGRLRDRIVRDSPASPYKEEGVPDLVQEQREAVC